MPIMKRILVSGAVLGLGIAVIGSIVGYLVDGTTGLISALIGAVMAVVFLAVTALSILVGNRAAHSDFLNPLFFIVVLGGWLLKFALFLVMLIVLKDQPWINNVVLLLTIIVGIIGSLVVDVTVIARSRQPYVDVDLPNSGQTDGDAPERSTPV